MAADEPGSSSGNGEARGPRDRAPLPGVSPFDGKLPPRAIGPGGAGDGGADGPKGPVARISAAILRVEAVALTVLMGAVAGLILLNVVTRTLGMALFWVDEAAIYAMIWMVLIGASVQLRTGSAIAVDLVAGIVPQGARRALAVTVSMLVLAFALTLAWLSWIWFDPMGIARAGFDAQAHSAATFNFIYQEPTVTVGIPKFLVWLIVPTIAATMSVHALANLVDAWRGRAQPKIEALASP